MTFPLTGILQFAPAGATVTYIGNTDGGLVTATNSATFSGVNIGTPTNDRLVVVTPAIAGVGGAVVFSSVLIGNVTATIATQKSQPPITGIAYLNVTSGTTADIKVTINASSGTDFQIGVYTVTGYSSSTPENTTATGVTSGNAASSTFTPSANAVTVWSIVQAGNNTITATWSGGGVITQDAQANFSGVGTRRYANGHISAMTNVAGTLTSAAVSAQVLAFAEWL